MPQNPLCVTPLPARAAPKKTFVRKPLIKDIIDRALLITNLQDDLEEYLKENRRVDPQYLVQKDLDERRYTNDLQRKLLRVFDDHQLTTEELNAITQTVLYKTRQLKLCALYKDEAKQQELMEKNLSAPLLSIAQELNRPNHLT